MKLLISLALSAFLPLAAMAQAAEPPTEPMAKQLTPLAASDVNLDDFLWQKRPIVVFADSANDPRFRDQIRFLEERPGELIKRDVVIIIDSDPSAKSQVRQKLRPRGFMLVVIDKGGDVVQRKPFPWDVRELSRMIDSLPLRQLEIRDQSAPSN